MKQIGYWIIFEIKNPSNPSKYWLKQIHISNPSEVPFFNYDDKGVKEMKLEIGNKDNNKWILCKPEIMNVGLNEKHEMQKFDVSVCYDKDFTHIRVWFLSNHGSTYRVAAKFIVHHLEFHGLA